MKLTNTLLKLALIIAIPQFAYAAKAQKPPLEELLGSPDRIRIVVADAVEKTTPEKIRFDIRKRLSGEAADSVEIRLNPATYDDVTIGQSYVVAFSHQREMLRIRKGWEDDPEGPSTVRIDPIGISAIFNASPELEVLFNPELSDQADASKRLVNALLGQLKYADVRGQGLASTELLMRPDLRESMGEQELQLLKDVIQTAPLSDQYRDLVLRSALELPTESTSPWLAEDLRKVIILYGTQYDAYSFQPTLVRTAARGLKAIGNASDLELLGLLLYANNPGVVKASLKSMDHLDSPAAREIVHRALEREWIGEETRDILSRFVDEDES